MHLVALSLISILAFTSVAEARFVVFGAGRSSGSHRPDPRDCVEWKYVEGDLWRCITKSMQEHERKLKGIKPTFKCEFTLRPHYQYGYCNDGKGKWETELRGSGPHPRDRFKTH